MPRISRSTSWDNGSIDRKKRPVRSGRGPCGNCKRSWVFMSVDERLPRPNPPDVDQEFVNSLAGFDESLRRGESALAASPEEGADDAEAAAGRACLSFLERAFPRTA